VTLSPQDHRRGRITGASRKSWKYGHQSRRFVISARWFTVTERSGWSAPTRSTNSVKA